MQCGTQIDRSPNDVFIAFHAPWCQHCQMMMPLLAKLAHTLESEDIDIVKYDATANDAPKVGFRGGGIGKINHVQNLQYFHVSSYPTIYFLKKHDKGSHIEMMAGRI